VDPEPLLDRMRQLADRLPDVVAETCDDALKEGLDRDVVTTLASGLIQHVRQRRAGLVKAPSRRRRAR
jgi:hypothetical protein